MAYGYYGRPLAFGLNGKGKRRKTKPHLVKQFIRIFRPK